jgi:hypothetical protein
MKIQQYSRVLRLHIMGWCENNQVPCSYTDYHIVRMPTPPLRSWTKMPGFAACGGFHCQIHIRTFLSDISVIYPATLEKLMQYRHRSESLNSWHFFTREIGLFQRRLPYGRIARS